MMQCPKFENKIFKNDKYCIRCGNIFDKEYFLQSEKFDIERELIKENIDYDNFNESFSKKYLIFNFAYAFYKKMYFVGIVSFISLILLLLVIKNFISIVVFFPFIFLLLGFIIFFCGFIQIYYIFNFNRIYFQQALFKVCKIIKFNKNLEYDELKKLCKKQFKPNIVLSIISVIVFILIFLGCIYEVY